MGKTNLSVNLALCLARKNKKVVLIDADLGLANVDVLLGLTPAKNLFHLFHEGASLKEILFPTPYGFSILPASSGVSDMLTLSSGQKLELLEAVDELEDHVDYPHRRHRRGHQRQRTVFQPGRAGTPRDADARTHPPSPTPTP